jgi:quercetin dioxygenase-like cupin family protein
VMMLPPGVVAPSHAHEVEEVFFVLKGEITAWWEHDDGTVLSTVLKEREMVFSPAGIMHGLRNHTDEETLVQVVIGVGRPQKPTYIDETLA